MLAASFFNQISDVLDCDGIYKNIISASLSQQSPESSQRKD